VSAPVRTCQRGYVQDGRRAGQVRRVHVVREEGPKGQRATETLCGQSTGPHVESQAIIREAPHDLPEGLSWCPTCTGRLAEQQGRTAEVAALLGLAPGGTR
jgi:hypothetical protein